jgi:hypothetical protein
MVIFMAIVVEMAIIQLLGVYSNIEPVE